MVGDEFTLDFQVGTTKKAHKILGILAGRSASDDDSEGEQKKKKSDNPKAPFVSMADAYMFALMLGLTTGNKEKFDSKNRVNYANFKQTVARDIDVAALLRHLGEESDMVDQESAKKAIEEYATWGLLRLDGSKLGDDDYRIVRMLDDMLAES